LPLGNTKRSIEFEAQRPYLSRGSGPAITIGMPFARVDTAVMCWIIGAEWAPGCSAAALQASLAAALRASLAAALRASLAAALLIGDKRQAASKMGRKAKEPAAQRIPSGPD
jgi:hypothetical protein